YILSFFDSLAMPSLAMLSFSILSFAMESLSILSLAMLSFDIESFDIESLDMLSLFCAKAPGEAARPSATAAAEEAIKKRRAMVIAGIPIGCRRWRYHRHTPIRR